MSLRRKQTVNWKTVERDWEEYFESFSNEMWRQEFIPVIEGLIIDQGEKWNAEFGIQFNVRDLFAEEWFDVYTLIFAQEIEDTTKTDISQMLQQAMENGWSIDEMSKQLNLTFDRYLDPNFTLEGRRLTDEETKWFTDRQPRFRRDMIVRTETIRASNAGSVALFEAWGVVELKEWLATADNRTRDTHLAAWRDYSEGGTPGPIPLDQPFHVGNSLLMFPGDPSGSPEEVIQCRCTALPFFAEFPSEQEQIDTAQGFISGELARREANE